MTHAVLVAIINSGVGILVSGIYIAMSIGTLRTRRWSSAVLPVLTAIAYVWPSTAYIYAVLHGTSTVTDLNPFGLLLIVLPALVVFQTIRRTKQDEADAASIIKGLESA